MLRARGRYLLMVDADGATNIRDLEKLMNELCRIERSDEEGHSFGISIGSRAHLQDGAVAKVSRDFHLVYKRF